MKKFSKILITLMVITGVAFLAVPSNSVFAQDEEPPMNPTETVWEPKTLDELYADLVDRYEEAGERIGRTNSSVSRLEDQIAKLEEKGRDPAELQAILDTLLANLAAVDDAYADVGKLIEDHAGFDDDGAVVDESLAVYTARVIAEGLLDLHQLGEDARFELRWDLMAYRYQHRSED